MSDAASPAMRSIRAFLCHSSGDKAAVRALFRRMELEGFIDVWLDEKKLLPGQNWDREIRRAVKNSDVVVVCLSKTSTTKEGYVQNEIKQALDVADNMPEETIFLIPLRLEECDVPERISRWHWVDYFEEEGYRRLIDAIWERADSLNIRLPITARATAVEPVSPRSPIYIYEVGDMDHIVGSRSPVLPESVIEFPEEHSYISLRFYPEGLKAEGQSAHVDLRRIKDVSWAEIFIPGTKGEWGARQLGKPKFIVRLQSRFPRFSFYHSDELRKDVDLELDFYNRGELHANIYCNERATYQKLLDDFRLLRQLVDEL